MATIGAWDTNGLLPRSRCPRKTAEASRAVLLSLLLGTLAALTYVVSRAATPMALYDPSARPVARPKPLVPYLTAGRLARSPVPESTSPVSSSRLQATPQSHDASSAGPAISRPVVSVGLAVSAWAALLAAARHFGAWPAGLRPPSYPAPTEIALQATAASHPFAYDLVVVGAGSGGVRASRIAASYGAKVALVEPSMTHGPPTYSAVGGTCVNVGCVPKKLMVYGSEYARALKDAQGYGWELPPGAAHNWTTLMRNKDMEIGRLNGVYKNMLGGAGVELVQGWGQLLDPHTVGVAQKRGESPARTLTANKILIAVGGWPFVPDIPGKEHCITSNEAFYLPERPRRVVVVGGGYIAVEFACIFRGFGSDVTLVHRGEHFLRGFDDDIVAHLAREMQQDGIALRFGTTIARVEKQSDGSLTATTAAGDAVPCDAVMFATGRKPYTAGLGLEALGVATHPATGAIAVNERSRTSVESVFAVGDVTDRINLTPVALLEGHCFADSEFGGRVRTPDYENVACAVFAHPTVAALGLTEATAVQRYRRVAVYKSGFRPMVHTMTGATTRALMKLLVDVDTDRVLGVHMCGPEAAEILQGIAIAVKMGATKADFDRTVGIHPTAAEEFVTMRTPSYFVVDGAKVDSL